MNHKKAVAAGVLMLGIGTVALALAGTGKTKARSGLRRPNLDYFYEQHVGYWQPDLQGISHISHAERAEMLVDYLGVSESQLARALQRLITDGKYELAASLLETSGGRFAHSESIPKLERLIYRKLMEQNQNTDPFKFLLYSAKAGEQLPQMAAAT